MRIPMDAITETTGREGHVGDASLIGIVTISDRASDGTYEDQGGPAILAFINEAIASPCTIHYICVPDVQATIEAALIELADDIG